MLGAPALVLCDAQQHQLQGADQTWPVPEGVASPHTPLGLQCTPPLRSYTQMGPSHWLLARPFPEAPHLPHRAVLLIVALPVITVAFVLILVRLTL